MKYSVKKTGWDEEPSHCQSCLRTQLPGWSFCPLESLQRSAYLPGGEGQDEGSTPSEGVRPSSSCLPAKLRCCWSEGWGRRSAYLHRGEEQDEGSTPERVRPSSICLPAKIRCCWSRVKVVTKKKKKRNTYIVFGQGGAVGRWVNCCCW